MFSDVSDQHQDGFNGNIRTRILPPIRPLHCLKVDSKYNYYYFFFTLYYYFIYNILLYLLNVFFDHFPESLPPLTTLYSTLFKRKHNQFKPDVKRRNILFNTFYQYFILQFFDTNFNPTVCFYNYYFRYFILYYFIPTSHTPKYLIWSGTSEIQLNIILL